MCKTANHYIKIPLVFLILFKNCFCFWSPEFQLKAYYYYFLKGALSKSESHLDRSRNISLNPFMVINNSHWSLYRYHNGLSWRYLCLSFNRLSATVTDKSSIVFLEKIICSEESLSHKDSSMLSLKRLKLQILVSIIPISSIQSKG